KASDSLPAQQCLICPSNCIPVVNLSTSFSIYPLGDSAITIDLGNCIDEHLNIRALAIHDWLQPNRAPGMTDPVVAYSSVSVFYDPAQVLAHAINGCHGAYLQLKALLEEAWEATIDVCGR